MNVRESSLSVLRHSFSEQADSVRPSDLAGGPGFREREAQDTPLYPSRSPSAVFTLFSRSARANGFLRKVTGISLLRPP